MARDAVTITELTPATPVDRPTGTTINATNGASIDVGSYTGNLVIIITNTNTTPDHDVTIQAGANPPGQAAGLGDIVFNLNAAECALVVDGSRHVQADGKIYIDFESGSAGKILAYRLTGV